MKILSFFNAKQPCNITWAHSANNKQKLHEAIESAQIIEGDIRKSLTGTPIMSHPPIRISKLSFYNWIDKIAQSNKGAKLDFKDKSIVETCIKYIKKKGYSIPIILNADILRGPNGRNTRFDPHVFIQICINLYPDAIISPGWVTGKGNEKYSEEHIKDMLSVVRQYKAEFSFPIRAQRYSEHVKLLLDNPKHTISLWNSLNDDPDDISWFGMTDPARTFYDVIDSSHNQIGYKGIAEKWSNKL